MAGSSWGPPRLDGFILTERLGSGTYATVYKAYAKWDSDNIYLIMEFCAGGDLSRFIHTRRILPEKVARVFMQQMASALQFLHARNISHLDLKPQNILLSSLEKPHLKLADFGFSQHMSPWDEKHVLRGSPLYMAPEMVCRRQYDARVDLWSVGVILYEALFGQPPFASRSFTELEEKIRSNRVIELPLRPQLSPDCQDLLRRLLERDPGRRISFQDFFAHPWVDLDHMPSEESLARAAMLAVQAVKKDQEGDAAAALSLYRKALDFLVPALRWSSHEPPLFADEVDAQRKEAIKAKVRQYVSRAEELKAIVSSSNQALLRQGASAQDLLREMARDKPRLLAALEVASAAVAKEEEAGGEQDALDLYQHSLGELLLLLAGEPPGRRRELLHTEVQNLMARAEYLKEQVKLAPCSDHRKMTAQTMGHLKLGDTPRLLPGILWPSAAWRVAFLDGQPCEHRVPGSLTASGCPPPHKGSDGPALHGLGALGLAPGEGAGLWEKCLM
ncbi:serine/threonine-protein kinase ULK3 isoform X6 [Myotis daubentonii]|uniref:serine/threonine-protein kinase ULK3 isoform X6 n=1 Tax=Myotis daubentonii TaxID=98922 RepID=UPI002872CE9F|nr:serine/threonine-protein kinase ULK3 isoform X6 [Myotis daubentonii]